MTICAQGRTCLFGDVVDGKMRLNSYGLIVTRCWFDLPKHYSQMNLEELVVMPNHVHGIINLTEAINPDVGAGLKPAPTTLEAKHHGLPEIVRGFKSFSSRQINRMRSTPGKAVWQRSYYDHVIRDENALHRIREYIVDNPANWQEDPENPLTAQQPPM